MLQRIGRYFHSLYPQAAAVATTPTIANISHGKFFIASSLPNTGRFDSTDHSYLIGSRYAELAPLAFLALSETEIAVAEPLALAMFGQYCFFHSILA